MTAFIAAVAVLAAALALWLWPGRGSDGGTEEGGTAEGLENTSSPRAEGEVPRTEGGKPAGNGFQVVPGSENGSPRLLFRFPDPDGWEVGPPPEGGYADLSGRWILEMEGSPYSLSNCHLVLNPDGTVSAPPDYEPVFEILESGYRWEPDEAAFQAALQLLLKLGSGPTAVCVELRLQGSVSASLREVTGGFSAVPEGEVYSPYVQQGSFRLHR